jgi:hypothetical protein
MTAKFFLSAGSEDEALVKRGTHVLTCAVSFIA